MASSAVRSWPTTCARRRTARRSATTRSRIVRFVFSICFLVLFRLCFKPFTARMLPKRNRTFVSRQHLLIAQRTDDNTQLNRCALVYYGSTVCLANQLCCGTAGCLDTTSQSTSPLVFVRSNAFMFCVCDFVSLRVAQFVASDLIFR
jgi:hypothetical protein